MMQVPITTFSRVEYIDAIPFSSNSTQTLPTNGGLLPNDRFMSFVILEFRGRLTMPAGTGPSAVRADSMAALVERVSVEGFHKQRRQQEKFFDLRGADIELLQRLYSPGTFIKTPALSVTANATNDMIFQLMIPFAPQRLPVAVQAGYLLDCPNYESLKLTVQWGDFKSIVVPGASDATWSAYGSASGSATMRVYGGFAIQPARFANFVPGRIWRYSQEVSGSIPTTTATGVRMFDIPRGYDIRSVAIKSGTKATDATAGNNAYQTLTEFMGDIRINLGLGKYIRRYLDHNAIHADLASSWNLASKITGFTTLDFAQNGSPGEILNTRPLIQGPTGNVDLYVQSDVTGAANQAANFILEEWRFKPVFNG